MEMHMVWSHMTKHRTADINNLMKPLSVSAVASIKRQKLKMSRSNLLITHLFALFCRLFTLAPWVGFSRGSSRRWMKTHATPHPPPSPLPAQAGTQRGRAATRTHWIPIPATRAPRQQTITVSTLPASAAHPLWPYVSLKYIFLNHVFCSTKAWSVNM